MNTPERRESNEQLLNGALDDLGYRAIDELLTSERDACQLVVREHAHDSLQAKEAWTRYVETGEQVIDHIVPPGESEQRIKAQIALIICAARVLLNIGAIERYIEEINIAIVYAYNAELDTIVTLLVDEIHYHGHRSVLD
jgi:hypothetical protein